MPKKDMGKLAGDGSKIQAELSFRLAELQSLKLTAEQYHTHIVPTNLEQIKNDLRFAATNKVSLTNAKKTFADLNGDLNKKIIKPFAKLIKSTDNTINKAYDKFKQNIIDVPAEYNFQATIAAIELILHDFNKLKSELIPIIDDLKVKIMEVESQLVKLATELQVDKMEKSAEKLSKEVAKLAQQQANLDAEPLSLGTLLEKLQDIQDAKTELEPTSETNKKLSFS